MQNLQNLLLQYKNKKIDKKILALIICVILIIVSVVVSYAWLWSERSVQTVTQIATIKLYISGGNKDDIEYIDLGDIDTKGDKGNVKFVFCVHGEDIEKYDLQLAHTTNIPFTYKIYKATEDENGDTNSIKYVSSDKECYYKLGDQIGEYLNKSTIDIIADESMQDKGYETGDNVQKNAYPLFCLETGIETEIDEGEFVDYYVLELSWTEAISSDKETDMVYLMVGVSDEEEEKTQ